MKANNTLKGQALRTYNRVMNAMAEDNTTSMYHTFAALTQQAKSMVLQSGKFSNAYVRGELKEMAIEEAAKDLTARAAACVSCKVRNIDMIIATAFLAEYISRQRKEIETPTTPETTDTMNTNTKTLTIKRSDWNETAKRLECAGWFYIGTPTATGKTIYRRDNSEIEIIIEEDTTPATMNETNTVEFSELSHAGQCLDIYLHNTAEIYERYTVPAIATAVEAKRYNERSNARIDDETAWSNLTFWISWQPVVKKALQAAVKLVKKYDHLTPTAKNIEQVTRNYAAYIVECAKYEIENA